MEIREFFWKAANAEGQIIQGRWQGTGLPEIRQRLFLEGYYPILIRSSRRITGVFSEILFFRRRHNFLKYWAKLSKRLGMLLEAGVPIISALELMDIQEQAKAANGHQTDWDEVKGLLEAGLDLSEALNSVIPPPSPALRALIRAGEQAGKLPMIFSQLASDLENEYQFRRKVRGILAYPSFLFLLSLGVIGALSIFVLPVYEQVFSSFDSSLPIATQVIFTIARWVPIVLSLLLLSIIAGLLILRLKYLKAWKDKLYEYLERVPGLSSMYKQSDQVQFFRILGMLIEAGIPLVEALNLTQDTVYLPSMKRKIQDLAFATREGRHLSIVLRADSFFAPDVSVLWAIGEESGELSSILQHLAQMMRQELEEKMERLNQVLGPVLVIGIAAIIGAVALGVMMPIFEIGTKIQ